jgi:hypothetical protein
VRFVPFKTSLLGLGCLLAGPTFVPATDPACITPDGAQRGSILDDLNVDAPASDVHDDRLEETADAHPVAKATPIPLPAPLLVGLAGLGISAAAARRKRRRPTL